VIPDSVRVKIYLEEAMVRTFERVKLVVSGINPRKARVEPSRVKVTLSGPKSLMKAMKRNQIKGRVIVENPKVGKYTLTPDIIVPSWAKVLEIKPAKVKVTVLK